jgi:hypothetical protein
MALAVKKLRMGSKMEAPKMESGTDLNDDSLHRDLNEKDRVADTKSISFDPKAVVLPFKKTLYALKQEGLSHRELEGVAGTGQESTETAKAQKLRPILSKALVYAVPVAMVCFLLGVRIGMVCMRNTHGSSLEIIWEALKF